MTAAEIARAAIERWRDRTARPWRVVKAPDAPGMYTVFRQWRRQWVYGWCLVAADGWEQVGPYYFLKADAAAEWARQHLWLIDGKEKAK